MQGEDYIKAKPAYHIGFLDFDLEHLSPEFYATFQLLNVKNHEIYSSKFVLSVVNLNQIELATEEDRKYGIDHWARLFKADTCEAVEEARRVRRGLERLVAEKDEVIAEKDAEIAHLKALLAATQQQ